MDQQGNKKDMENPTEEQLQQAFLAIELSINLQRSLEIIEEMEIEMMPNKKIRPLLRGLIQPLEKQCEVYNDFFKVDEKTVMYFYDVTRRNAKYIMSHDLIDQSRICGYLMASEKDPKAVEGIIKKVLKK
jgi:hypothetical protein